MKFDNLAGEYLKAVRNGLLGICASNEIVRIQLKEDDFEALTQGLPLSGYIYENYVYVFCEMENFEYLALYAIDEVAHK